MNIDSAHPLFLLPFDNCIAFKKGLLGITGPPDAAGHRRVADLKTLIWEGFEQALASSAPRQRCGVLVKVLVRYNPEGARSFNARQENRLAQLSEWLRAHGRQLLVELLVPPTAAQTAKTRADPEAYERDLLPGLIVAAIAVLQDAEVEPDIWKIQGIDDRADCERAAAQARIARNYLDMIDTYQAAAAEPSERPASVGK